MPSVEEGTRRDVGVRAVILVGVGVASLVWGWLTTQLVVDDKRSGLQLAGLVTLAGVAAWVDHLALRADASAPRCPAQPHADGPAPLPGAGLSAAGPVDHVEHELRRGEAPHGAPIDTIATATRPDSSDGEPSRRRAEDRSEPERRSSADPDHRRLPHPLVDSRA
jgi:hypothetical protein